ncbi:hypothetical protein FACS189483_06440 [Spirochaetia bacterium]|nr:hypothetical protein FACS189483_06440 [Spirochaetia bacterium]
MHNILLIANDTYFPLLHVCLKSLYAVCKLDSIGKIFIANLGLTENSRNILQNFGEKVELVDTDILIDNSNEIHSKGWVDAVSQKTRIFKNLAENGNIPLIMLDSDMIIIEDFSDVIDSNFDIQVCRRSKPLIRPDGLVVNHIASFFVVNNRKGLSFVNDWIDRMHERIDLKMFPPHETPAMVETISKNTILNIGDIDDKIVSCENNYIPDMTKIVHAKGRTTKDKISIFRFSNIQNLPYKKTLYLFTGKEKFLFTLSFLSKKIFNFYELKNRLRELKKSIKKQTKNKQ